MLSQTGFLKGEVLFPQDSHPQKPEPNKFPSTVIWIGGNDSTRIGW